VYAAYCIYHTFTLANF